MLLFAQPYCASSLGFYFSDLEEYNQKLTSSTSEEFEIHFIDGDDFESTLAHAIDLNQGNVARYFELADDGELEERIDAFVYLVDHVGYDIESALEKLEDVDLYEGSINDWAYDMASDCLGLEGVALDYFNCEAYARDCQLNGDIAQIRRDLYVTNANSL